MFARGCLEIQPNKLTWFYILSGILSRRLGRYTENFSLSETDGKGYNATLAHPLSIKVMCELRFSGMEGSWMFEHQEYMVRIVYIF